jgi:AcrR family transcriptional regulator
MPKHFSTEDKEEIRRNLILAGKKLFTQYGFSKTTITDITQEAKIGKGTFYLFFETKGDIFVEIYTEEWINVHNLMKNKFLHKKGKLSDLITEYIYDNKNYLFNQPLLSIVYDREALNAITDKGAHAKLAQFAKLSNEKLKTIVDSWIEAKHLDMSLSPEIIVGMMSCLSFLNFHRDAIIGVDYDEIIKYLIEGISLVVTEHGVAVNK